MKIIVKDANILIDIIKLGMLPHLFDLDLDFHVTNYVLDELLPDQQKALDPYIDNEALFVYNLTVEDLIAITTLNQQYPRLSDKDCSAWHYATTVQAMLITSDNHLRKSAEAAQLEVHGHLWVFDRMVEQETITGPRAAQKLTELRETVNQKLGLPEEECTARINKWTKLINPPKPKVK